MAEHRRGDFVGAVVTRGVGRLDGADETFHVFVPDGHRLAIGVAQKPVLERLHRLNNRVEDFTPLVCENEVMDVRHAPPFTPAIADEHFLHHGGEAFDSLLLQHLVGGQLSIATGQVTHDEPLPAVIGGRGNVLVMVCYFTHDCLGKLN